MIGLRLIAMFLAVAGLALCLVSVYLSYTLFSNISDVAETKIVWGTAAVAFEVIKFTLIPIATYLFYKEMYVKTSFVTVGLLILMVTSITASVGSLSKGTGDSDARYYKAVDLKTTKEESIADLYSEIKKRDVSITVFQEAKKISNGSLPLQKDNERDFEEIRKLKAEKNAIEIPSRDALSQAISDFSIILGKNERTAKPQVFLIFAILVDVFAGLSLLVAEAIYLLLIEKNDKDKQNENKRLEEESKNKRDYDLMTLKLHQDHELNVKRVEENRASIDLKLSERKNSSHEVKIDNTLKPVPQSNVYPLNVEGDELERAKKLVANGDLSNPPLIRDLIREYHFDRGSAEKIRKYFQEL